MTKFMLFNRLIRERRINRQTLRACNVNNDLDYTQLGFTKMDIQCFCFTDLKQYRLLRFYDEMTRKLWNRLA